MFKIYIPYFEPICSRKIQKTVHTNKNNEKNFFEQKNTVGGHVSFSRTAT